MSREILFRGKQIDNEEWEVGGVFSSKDYTGIIVNAMRWVEVDPKTVCQYTGLTDKNGRKIFEGDIVILPAWMTNHGEYAVCKYIDPANEVVAIIGFAFFDANGKLVDSDEWDEFEVIGNIFDNPELLEGE